MQADKDVVKQTGILKKYLEGGTRNDKLFPVIDQPTSN
jgi:hypothetical protein